MTINVGQSRETITVRLACSRHQHQQSHGKAPKRRLRFLPSPKCRVRLQRGRRQQPAHKNERRGALDAAAAMRSNKPQNLPPFPAARVKHTAHASTGTTSAAHSTARAPLQPHLHSLQATPRHTLHHRLSPAPRHEGRVHVGRRSGQSLARECHTSQHEGHRGAGGNYFPSRLLTASASAIKWQSTETPFPYRAESKISRPPATRAAAAACTRE